MDSTAGIALGTGITTVGGIITLIITQHYQAKRAREQRLLAAERVAKEVAEGKKDLVQAAEKVADVVQKNEGKLTDIHTLVDGNMTKVQNELASVARQLKKANAVITQLKQQPSKK